MVQIFYKNCGLKGSSQIFDSVGVDISELGESNLILLRLFLGGLDSPN